MAKLSPVGGTPTATEQVTVANAGTRTTPDNEKAGTLEAPNVVTSLLLYGTDSISLLPKTVKYITMGSGPGQNIEIASPFVSEQHCRLERTGELLRVRDLKSKNGTFTDGERPLCQGSCRMRLAA
jgi:pSer/pThr/pTyr-binding forkhead associated (FHA) protein